MFNFRSGTHGLNEELGRHRGREGKTECFLCGIIIISVSQDSNVLLFLYLFYHDNYNNVCFCPVQKFGYAPDFVQTMKPLLKDIKQKGTYV